MSRIRMMAAGVVAVTLLGAAASLVGLERLGLAAVVVLAGLTALLVLDLLRRVSASARKLDKLRASVRAGAGARKQGRAHRPVDQRASTADVLGAFDASVDRLTAALAMERLAQADRHNEVRREIAALQEALDASSGSER